MMHNWYSFLARFFESVGQVRGRQLAQPHRKSKHAKGRQKAEGWKAKRKKRRQMAKRSRRINWRR